MIIFAIALRAPETTKHWDTCVKMFNQTLKSIFNQTNENFRCIVACNEIPELDREYDDRLEFIELDLPIPKIWIEMARDKFWKYTVVAVRIREILASQKNPENGIYVMPIDADDVFSNKISEYCERYPNENGFVSKDGYLWEDNKSYLRIYKDLHTFCGSCNIVKMYLEDLPERMPYPNSMCHDQSVAGELNARYPIRFDHHTLIARYEANNKPFKRLPFRSTIYVKGYGENISFVSRSEDKSATKKRFHPVAFLRSINIFRMKRISKKIRKEYGLI